MRAVGRQRVQGRRAEPLGVLVQQHRPQAELGALLQQRGEVARGRTVIALHLIEEDPERFAPLGRQVGAPASGVQQVEEEQVGDQPIAGAAGTRAGEDDLAPVHRLADPVGALALAE